MDRYAIFVDAGYFFAAGAEAAFCGEKTPRKQVSLVSPSKMLEDLCSRAAAVTEGLPLLRVYWYDAMPGPRLSLEQSSLAMLKGLKLRLGALNSAGEQKGVDSLIVTDIIDLARNRAIADAVIVTGDEDLRIAVQVAQSFGVKVHILAAGDASKNVSPSLQMEADSVSVLDAEWFQSYLKREEKATLTVKHTVSPRFQNTNDLDSIAQRVIKGLLENADASKIRQLIEQNKTTKEIPSDFDRPLIARVGTECGRRLSSDECRHIRGLFVQIVREHPALGA